MSESVRVAMPRDEVTGAARAGSQWRQWLWSHHWVVALVGYMVLTLAVTFPLILHLGDSIIGPYAEGDNLWYVWYLWAFRHMLSTGQDPAFTHLMYALLPQVQLFAASYYSGIVGFPLLSIMTPLATYNVLILLTFVLSGLTTYLLTHEFVANRWACFVAGFLYTFSTLHFWRVISGLSLVTMQWLPLAAWRVLVFYRRPTWSNAIWLGLSITLIPLADLYLSAYFLPSFFLLFIVGIFIANRKWLTDRTNLLKVGLGLSITALITLPVFVSSLRVDPEMQAAIALKSSSTQQYSANLIAYVLPHPGNPFFGGMTARFYQHIPSMQYPAEQSNYLGLVAVVLAASAFLFKPNRTRMAFFWLALGVLAFLLSLGPVLQVGGHLLFPLPFYGWVYNWPVLSNFRAPNRIGPVVLLAVAVLAGYALNRLFPLIAGAVQARSSIVWHSRVVVVGLCIAIMGASLAEHVQFAFPMTMTTIHIPAVYAQMAEDPVPGLVLTLPTYPRGSDMFFQTIHHRRIVAGYPIRATYSMIRSVENIPYASLFDWPNSAQANDPAAGDEGRLHDIFQYTETFKQGLQEYGIRYVVLLTAASPPVEPWMRPLLVNQLGTPFYDNVAEGVIVWRIDPGAQDSQSYHFKLGSGWRPGLRILNGTVVRYVLQDARLNIVAPQTALQHIVVTASAVGGSRTMLVSVNGVHVLTADFALPDTFQSVDLGMVPLHAGLNVLEVRSAQPCAKTTVNIPPTLNPDCNVFDVAQVLVTAP